jgi:multidrug efflux pump subunit AcrA (membrane-fusion protein)
MKTSHRLLANSVLGLGLLLAGLGVWQWYTPAPQARLAVDVATTTFVGTPPLVETEVTVRIHNRGDIDCRIIGSAFC